MIVIVDGPEKVGKTTFCMVLATLLKHSGFGVLYYKPEKPADDVEFLDALRLHAMLPLTTVAIWDRSWASNHVYAKCMGEKQYRLAGDPLLGEWLYGRIVQTLGLRIMLMTDYDTLKQRRDETDLPVSILREECNLFAEYAMNAQWDSFYLMPGVMDAEGAARRTVCKLLDHYAKLKSDPVSYDIAHHYCGPWKSPLIVVGTLDHAYEKMHGTWLPFTDTLGSAFLRQFKWDALQIGWTYERQIPPQLLQNRVVATIGAPASRWVAKYAHPAEQITMPSFRYVWSMRSSKGRNQIESGLERMMNVIKNI